MKSVEILGDKFIQRWDVRAEQQEDGSYLCIREPLTRILIYEGTSLEIRRWGHMC